jgi:hypothetical protein
VKVADAASYHLLERDAALSVEDAVTGTASGNMLIDMGFEEQEAESAIEVDPSLGEELFGEGRRPSPSTRIEVAAEATTLAAVKAAAPERVSVEDGAIG